LIVEDDNRDYRWFLIGCAYTMAVIQRDVGKQNLDRLLEMLGEDPITDADYVVVLAYRKRLDDMVAAGKLK